MDLRAIKANRWAIAALASAALVACQQSKSHQEDPQRCASCHMDEFRAAKDHQGKKPTACAVCHSQDGWSPSIFDHPFALTGAHQKLDCFQCHTGTAPKFVGTPKACFGCHRADYEKAPNHVARKFPQKCDECHNTEAFSEQLPNAPAPPGGSAKPKSPPKPKQPK